VVATLAGVDATSKIDNALRKAFLGAEGGLAAAELATESGNAKKPDATKRTKKLADAHAKFDKATDKAIAGAAKKSVTYDGAAAATVATVATNIDALVSALVTLLSGG